MHGGGNTAALHLLFDPGPIRNLDRVLGVDTRALRRKRWRRDLTSLIRNFRETLTNQRAVPLADTRPSRDLFWENLHLREQYSGLQRVEPTVDAKTWMVIAAI